MTHRFIFSKLIVIVGLSLGNLFGLMLRFMPNWWSFLIFWILMQGKDISKYHMGSIWGYMGLYGVIWGYMGLYGVIWGFLG